MNLVWSDEAVYALVSLETRLAEQYSDEKAAQIVEELVRRVDHLRDHPQLGRAVPEYGHWQLRELVDKWNRVLYRLRPDAIEIVTIVPARLPLETGLHGMRRDAGSRGRWTWPGFVDSVLANPRSRTSWSRAIRGRASEMRVRSHEQACQLQILGGQVGIVLADDLVRLTRSS